MRILDLGAVYFALGLLFLVAMIRRARRTPVDAVLLVVLWPLYLPVLLSDGAAFPSAKRTAASPLLTEHDEMKKALGSVNDPTVARLLPSPQHIDKLFAHLRSLDEKVKELGDTRFAVGLWVGRSATANTLDDVAKKVLEYPVKSIDYSERTNMVAVGANSETSVIWGGGWHIGLSLKRVSSSS